MFLNKAKLRKASSRVALLLATGSLLATGISPAHAADATPLFLSFEANDPLKSDSVTASFGDPGVAIAASANLTGDALIFTKTGTAWSGTNIILPSSTTKRFADAANTIITLDYFSNDAGPSPVQLRLEGPNGGQVTKVVEAAPGKSTLSFDMSTGQGWNAAIEYNALIIYPNFSGNDSGYTGSNPVDNTGQIYEIDNISIAGGTVADIYVPVVVPAREETSTLLTFETSDTLGAKAVGESNPSKPDGSFSGAVTVIVDAPAGGNGGKVLEITKAGDAWSGVNLVTAPDGVKFGPIVTMNYYSPETVNTPVQLQLLVGTSQPISQAVEAAPGWQTLTFDFTATYNATKEYTKAVIFPNFRNAGDVPGYTGAPAAPVAGKKFAIDNVGFNGATTPAIPVPSGAASTLLTFETSDTLGAKAVGESNPSKPDGSFSGAVTVIVDAPAGGNGGKVLEITKAGDAWSGVNLVTAPDGVKFGPIVTMNYYSPETVNTPVQLQLLVGTSTPVSQAVQAVPGWQRLSFDFTATFDATKEYTKAVIFPNFVNAGDVPGYAGAPAAPIAGKKFAIDNVGFNGATTPTIPVPVVKVKPSVRTAASVAGSSTKVAKTLTAGKGLWSGSSTITYTYKWYRCSLPSTTTSTSASTPSKCATISGATKSTYKLASADVGKYIRVLVAAKNTAGTAYSMSKTTSKKVVK